MTHRRPTPTEAALDALLDRDRPEPGPDFDARVFARLAAEPTRDGRLDALLDPAVGADRPAPRADFDARVFDRLADATADDGLDALLDADLDAARAEPGPDFDARVIAALDAERDGGGAGAPTGGARVLRFVRRPAFIVPLLAAAAALVLWIVDRPPADPPADELALLSHLELLEVYDELEVLDGIADEETFELVAMLHTLDEQEARP